MARGAHPSEERLEGHLPWEEIDALGAWIDRRMNRLGLHLTMGGEPTYISGTDFSSPQWRCQADGADKRRLARALVLRLGRVFPAGGMFHFGVGKWYPGEDLPRWALAYLWRCDGKPLRAGQGERSPRGRGGASGPLAPRLFLEELCRRLDVPEPLPMPLHECSGREAVGYALPLLKVDGAEGGRWASCRWHPPGGRLVLTGGSGPAGCRLPLADIPCPPAEQLVREWDGGRKDGERQTPLPVADNSIRTALCLEWRNEALELFLPPMARAKSYLELVSTARDTAAALQVPLSLGGYLPPFDGLLQGVVVTPDPGVLEVNLPAASSWPELVETCLAVDSEARRCGLVTQKYLPNGHGVGTGGGSHLTLGGKTLFSSPFSKRPDLLRSLLTCWQNHPGLSYAFSGLFAGPTSQAPRVDEGGFDRLGELEMAMEQLQAKAPPSLRQIDRLLRYLLVDGCGNGHRSEFCIDKLCPEDSYVRRLGILELRGLEMPPHPRLWLVICLLVRALVLRFWERPCTAALVRWGPALHDRFLLPHFIAADLRQVVWELRQAGVPFEFAWLEPLIEFRFPRCAFVPLEGAALELRHAVELWPVLGDAAAHTGASRPVDSSCERLQVKVTGAGNGEPALLCNGRRVPLVRAGPQGDWVAGVRFKAWALEQALHPDIPAHVPLRFELVDNAARFLRGGCVYHVSRPDGSHYEELPGDAGQAWARRRERCIALPPGPFPGEVPALRRHRESPLTLDLRRGQG